MHSKSRKRLAFFVAMAACIRITERLWKQGAGNARSGMFCVFASCGAVIPVRRCVKNGRRCFAIASSGDINSWSVRELRNFLTERSIPHHDCIEKAELVNRVHSSRDQSVNEKEAPRQTHASRSEQFKGFGQLVKVGAVADTDEQDPSSVLFFHGLGDTAQGWSSSLPTSLNLRASRYVFPTAKTLSVPGASATPQGITSWFDATALAPLLLGSSDKNIFARIGARSMQKSIDYCHHLIREEIRQGVPSRRIFIGGFSQGGCIAIRAALSFLDAPLGGCIAASTFLGDDTDIKVSDANRALPIICCHGDRDPVVPFDEGLRIVECLRARGVRVIWKPYSGLMHTSTPQELKDIRIFIQQRLLVDGGDAGLQRLSARGLRSLLIDLDIDTTGCLEKDDFLALARTFILEDK